MELNRVALAAVCLWCAQCAAQAQWPDTPQSRAFRQRVIDLALLYGESSGIDEAGFMIHAQVVAPAGPPCKTVAVDIHLGGTKLREDSFQACGK